MKGIVVVMSMNRKFLMDKDFLKYINSHIDLFIEANVNSRDSEDRPEIHIVWDSFNAYIRGVMMDGRKEVESDNKLSKVRDEVE